MIKYFYILTVSGGRMKYLELWLDESGDFEKDYEKVKKGYNCSFVGGILCEKGTVTGNSINSLIKGDFFHCCETKDKSEQFDIFSRISELCCNFVIFSNTECIYTVDNNLTYQNIICEGIVKLLKYLKGKYGEIHLDILIANRVDTTLGLNPSLSVVPTDTYIRAIESKLIMAGIKNSIDEKSRTLQTASARKDKRLMLADIVCNTILTRNAKCFSKEQSDFINGIYTDKEKTIVFNVFENSTEEIFYALMCQGRIGEAVTALCQSENTALVGKLMEIVKENILSMHRNDIELQFKFIALTVEYFIRVTREYERCISFINNIDIYFLSILKISGEQWSDSLYRKLHLDLTFYLFTLYTYRGDTVNSKRCEEECDSIFEKNSNDWDTILYSANYELRKISNLINCFEYDRAEADADKLISKAKEMKSLLEIISPDEKINLNILAKAYGCRAQIYSEKIKTDSSYYALATSDSDNAINEFENEPDKQRQYFYRVMIEARYKNYNEALKFLYMQCDVTDGDMKTLAKTVCEKGGFPLYSYLFLMSYAKKGNCDFSDDMYRLITALYDFRKHIEEPVNNEHPYEVSVLCLARYESLSKSRNSAIKNFGRVIDACFDHNDYFQWLIALCASAEKYSLSEDKSDKRQMCQIYKKLSECGDLPEGIRKIIDNFDTEKTEKDYFVSFSHKTI